MIRLFSLALLTSTTAAQSNGSASELSDLFSNTPLGEQICYMSESLPTDAEQNVTGLDLILTPYGESYNGTAQDNGFTFTLNLDLSGSPDEMLIYGCCDQAGYCGTGETCFDQPIFLRTVDQALEVDISTYPRMGPSGVLTPEAERPTLGSKDAKFILAPAECIAP